MPSWATTFPPRRSGWICSRNRTGRASASEPSIFLTAASSIFGKSAAIRSTNDKRIMSVPDQNLPTTGYSLSPLQQRLWQRANADALAYRIEALITLRGTVETAELQRALDLVLGHNEILRTTFHHPEGRAEPLQMIHDN